MSDLTLTEVELVELTGYSRPHEQGVWLEAAGIPFRPKRDGRLCVVRAWVENAPFANKDRIMVETGFVDPSGPRMDKIGAKAT